MGGLTDLVGVVNESVSVNIAQPTGLEDGSVVVTTYRLAPTVEEALDEREHSIFEAFGSRREKGSPVPPPPPKISFIPLCFELCS